MSMSPFIAQFFQYGDSFKNCCVAVIVPEEEAIKKWARENNVDGDFKHLCESDELKALMKGEVDRLARDNKLSSLEKPKEFVLSPEPFSVENNILTSTFKLKRNIAREVFQAQIDAMYVKAEAEEAARANASRA